MSFLTDSISLYIGIEVSSPKTLIFLEKVRDLLSEGKIVQIYKIRLGEIHESEYFILKILRENLETNERFI